jgi:hypothetical protein
MGGQIEEFWQRSFALFCHRDFPIGFSIVYSSLTKFIQGCRHRDWDESVIKLVPANDFLTGPTGPLKRAMNRH